VQGAIQVLCFTFTLLSLNTADSGRDGQFVTISYQLSSQKCLEDGWTVFPLARRSSFHCNSIDSHSSHDDALELDEPLYKVSHCSMLMLFVPASRRMENRSNAQ